MRNASAPFSGWTGVTRREGEALFYIGWFIETYGYGPCRADLRRHVGSYASVIVAKLRRKGLIESMPRKARAIRLTKPVDTSFVPVQLAHNGARSIAEFHEVAMSDTPSALAPAGAALHATRPLPLPSLNVQQARLNANGRKG